MTRLTFDERDDLQPIWTPDGNRMVFSSNRDGKYTVYWKAADGTGEDEKIGSVPDRALIPYCLSSDGKILVMAELFIGSSGALSKGDIGILSMGGDHTRKPLLNAEYVETQPKISPDGQWIAYTSNESGKNEIYVRPFPEVNKGHWQVSTNGGDSPLWSPDGRELFYLNSDSVMAVAVETKPSFNPGTPKVLFRGTYVGSLPADGCPWDISPDGKRFLMMKEPGSIASAGGGPSKISIVVNWFEELKQRVPVK